MIECLDARPYLNKLFMQNMQNRMSEKTSAHEQNRINRMSEKTGAQEIGPDGFTGATQSSTQHATIQSYPDLTSQPSNQSYPDLTSQPSNQSYPDLTSQYSTNQPYPDLANKHRVIRDNWKRIESEMNKTIREDKLRSNIKISLYINLLSLYNESNWNIERHLEQIESEIGEIFLSKLKENEYGGLDCVSPMDFISLNVKVTAMPTASYRNGYSYRDCCIDRDCKNGYSDRDCKNGYSDRDCKNGYSDRNNLVFIKGLVVENKREELPINVQYSCGNPKCHDQMKMIVANERVYFLSGNLKQFKRGGMNETSFTSKNRNRKELLCFNQSNSLLSVATRPSLINNGSLFTNIPSFTNRPLLINGSSSSLLSKAPKNCPSCSFPLKLEKVSTRTTYNYVVNYEGKYQNVYSFFGLDQKGRSMDQKGRHIGIMGLLRRNFNGHPYLFLLGVATNVTNDNYGREWEGEGVERKREGEGAGRKWEWEGAGRKEKRMTAKKINDGTEKATNKLYYNRIQNTLPGNFQNTLPGNFQNKLYCNRKDVTILAILNIFYCSYGDVRMILYTNDSRAIQILATNLKIPCCFLPRKKTPRGRGEGNLKGRGEMRREKLKEGNKPVLLIREFDDTKLKIEGQLRNEECPLGNEEWSCERRNKESREKESREKETEKKERDYGPGSNEQPPIPKRRNLKFEFRVFVKDPLRILRLSKFLPLVNLFFNRTFDANLFFNRTFDFDQEAAKGEGAAMGEGATDGNNEQLRRHPRPGGNIHPRPDGNIQGCQSGNIQGCQSGNIQGRQSGNIQGHQSGHQNGRISIQHPLNQGQPCSPVQGQYAAMRKVYKGILSPSQLLKSLHYFYWSLLSLIKDEKVVLEVFNESSWDLFMEGE